MTKLPELKPTANPSSNVEATAHHEGRLFVRFRGRPTFYSYADVPAEVHDEMAASKSPGTYLRANVLGKFPHEKHELEDK